MTSSNRWTRLIYCCICLTILFVSARCTHAEQLNQAAAQSPTSTRVVVPSSTPDPHAQCHTQICKDSVPVPTIVPANQQKFFELLEKNGSCELPCFLGIMPGQTQWASANDTLKPFVVRNPIPYDETRRTKTNRTYSTSIRTKPNQDIPISMEMGLSIGVDQNDVVQHMVIRVELYGDGFTEFNDKHLL